MRTAASVLLAGALALLAHECGAQQAVQVGERIRVTAPPLLPEPQPGTLVSVAADRLVLEGRGMDLGSLNALPTTWVVPRDLVTDLERSLGYERRGGKGFLIGAGVGLVGSLLVVSSGDFNACRGSGDYGKFCTYIVVGSTLGSGLIGLLIGSLSASELWEPVAASEAF